MQTKQIRLDEIREYARALHCPTRWKIIWFLSTGNQSTSEIEEFLKDKHRITGKPNLYYHLSELSSVGIIEVAQYREEGGGAPEKVWKLTTKRLIINLLGGEKEDGGEHPKPKGRKGQDCSRYS